MGAGITDGTQSAILAKISKSSINVIRLSNLREAEQRRWIAQWKLDVGVS